MDGKSIIYHITKIAHTQQFRLKRNPEKTQQLDQARFHDLIDLDPQVEDQGTYSLSR